MSWGGRDQGSAGVLGAEEEMWGKLPSSWTKEKGSRESNPQIFCLQPSSTDPQTGFSPHLDDDSDGVTLLTVGVTFQPSCRKPTAWTSQELCAGDVHETEVDRSVGAPGSGLRPLAWHLSSNVN